MNIHLQALKFKVITDVTKWMDRKLQHFFNINMQKQLILLAAKSLQSCPILCDPVDSSPPGFPVPGILQARTLEWVAISFSNAWKWKVKVKSLSRARLLATPWTAAYQAPPSMGFPGKSTGVGCHCLLHILPTFAFYVNRTKNTVCNFSLCDWLFSLKVVFVGISILLLIAVHC